MNPSLDPLIDYYSLKRPVNWSGQFAQSEELNVEIGFGMGEVLVKNALAYPKRRFVGIEQNWERIYKTLKTIARLNKAGSSIENIRILHVDARDAFERLFPLKSIDHIYSLFPCPWPKKKHVKHRLFSQEFLCLLNSRLKPKGSVQIVTDFAPYKEWLLEEARPSGFSLTTQTIKARFDTKFERKWQSQGQDDFFEINLLKKKHIRVPLIKDQRMKSYKLKQFNPERFRFNDVHGDISVIFKEMNFDPLKQYAMVQCLVCEGHLSQYFWTVILKRENHWLVCRGDGQRFFPTPGIAKAIELIYKAANET